jgi:hypothetical protein
MMKVNFKSLICIAPQKLNIEDSPTISFLVYTRQLLYRGYWTNNIYI